MIFYAYREQNKRFEVIINLTDCNSNYIYEDIGAVSFCAFLCNIEMN